MAGGSAAGIAVAVVGAFAFCAGITGPQHIYQLRVQSALSDYDCGAPLEGQTFEFDIPAALLHTADGIHGNVVIVNAERLDKTTPPAVQDTMKEFPIRIVGETSGGKTAGYDGMWS